MIDVVFLSYEITKGMKSFGPKGIIPIGKRNQEPLIVKQLNQFNNSRKYRINIIVGFEHDKIIKAVHQAKISANIIYNHNFAKDNAGYAIRLALNKIGKSNFLFIDNGIITNYSPKDTSYSKIPLLKKNDNGLFEIGATKSETIEYLFYDLNPRWSELLFISKNDFDAIANVSNNNRIDHLFFFEYINLLIDHNIDIHSDIIHKKQIQKILNHKSIK